MSHSSLRERAAKPGSSSGLGNLLALPKLSLNGTPNPLPMSPYKKSFSELEESKARRRELDDHEPTYPEVFASPQGPTSASSPIIPLSPDPFGRWPSFPSTPSTSSTSQSSTFLDRPVPSPKNKYSAVEVPSEQNASGSQSQSSRFSLDSTDEGKNNRISASLNPVKSIKSLWKKGRKASISFGSGSAAAAAAALQTGSSPPSSQPPPPPIPHNSSTSTPRSLTPAPSTASRESVASLVIPSDRYAPKSLYHDVPSFSTSQLQQSRSTPSISSMVFNQESPYPVHVLSPGAVARRRTASQAARAISSASLVEVDVMLSPTTEKEKASVPKSILKSRRTESSAGPLPLEQQHAAPRTQSRADTTTSRSTSMGGGVGGRVTTSSSSSESTRISPTKSRQWTNLPPLPSQSSPNGEITKL